MYMNSQAHTAPLNAPLSESMVKTANNERPTVQPIPVKGWSPKAVFTNPLIIGVSHYDATLRRCATIVLHPKGRIDQNSVHILRASLMDAIREGADAVIVDFTGVDYINGAGLHALMTALKKAQDAQVWLAVSNLRPTVKEVFEISRCSCAVAVIGTVRRRREIA